MKIDQKDYFYLMEQVHKILSISNIQTESPEVMSASEVFSEVFESMKYEMPAVNLPQWPKFTEFTGGFRDREFSIICGSTGSGKTEFLANISSQLMFTCTPHVVWSIETGPIDFGRRVLSVLSGENLNNGEMIKKEILEKVKSKYEKFFNMSTLSLFRYENRIKSEILLCDLLYANKFLGAKIAMIDNLNFFLDVTTSTEQIIEMDRVIHDIIIFCKQVDMHIIMIMHPRKTHHGRVESIFDIKGSSTAVQEAHNVFLFNRPTAEDLNSNISISENHREVTIAKMRRRGTYVGKKIWFSSIRNRYSELS